MKNTLIRKRIQKTYPRDWLVTHRGIRSSRPEADPVSSSSKSSNSSNSSSSGCCQDCEDCCYCTDPTRDPKVRTIGDCQYMCIPVCRCRTSSMSSASSRSSSSSSSSKSSSSSSAGTP